MNQHIERESMEFDVVIVGAGPAGLSAACRLKQLAQQDNHELSVVVVEKGSEVGSHILSGNVFETRALDELFPNWKSENAPIKTSVNHDEFYYLRNEKSSLRIPELFIPRPMRNKKNYIISLGQLCQWLATKAESLGVDIFSGFAASEILFDENGVVRGIATSDMGINKKGEQKPSFQTGYELLGKHTIFAEGCRGNLGEQLMDHFKLRENADPQHYGIGIKEIWEIDTEKHKEGLVVHTLGWPLDNHTEGGGFLYHASGNQVFIGIIVALNYKNPYLSPYDEFQRWKHHPRILRYLEGGRRISYGARAVNKGGFQSLPKLSFPGGMIIGCDAGFLNGAKIKGTHTAIKSGMLAAESIFEAKNNNQLNSELDIFQQKYENSWLYDELYSARNFGPGLNKLGIFFGAIFTFIDQNIFFGKLPFTWKNTTPDHLSLNEVSEEKPIKYPKPDGIVSFDILSSVFLSSTNHEEDQPSHLKLQNTSIPITHNLPKYDEPAQRYCPAGVYEIVKENNQPRFQINAQNCVHCKTCDIKDPSQNIIWTVPEGGGGPNYSGM